MEESKKRLIITGIIFANIILILIPGIYKIIENFKESIGGGVGYLIGTILLLLLTCYWPIKSIIKSGSKKFTLKK